ncbi:hypothetical protein J2R98_001404 [Alkalibacillus filiformis]|uniref:Uncharacterized protein n=1 Tax=Alkalibacillus filiformis TaxID=200990 RepID=A0ABU0DT00_9BACI|nr:hypothetical protein [Alkalibacillus filiformis]
MTKDSKAPKAKRNNEHKVPDEQRRRKGKSNTRNTRS